MAISERERELTNVMYRKPGNRASYRALSSRSLSDGMNPVQVKEAEAEWEPLLSTSDSCKR